MAGPVLVPGDPGFAEEVTGYNLAAVTAPAVVVNEAFARRHFGRDNPIGRRFRAVGDDEHAGPWRTIVGVTRTVRMLGIYNSPLVDDSGFYLNHHIRHVEIQHAIHAREAYRDSPIYRYRPRREP